MRPDDRARLAEMLRARGLPEPACVTPTVLEWSHRGRCAWFFGVSRVLVFVGAGERGEVFDGPDWRERLVDAIAREVGA